MDIKAETVIMKKTRSKTQQPTEKLMSPGILQPVLQSSWRVQWWSEFNGVGKRNSGEGSKHFAASPCFLRVSLMASGHARAWVWCSDVQRPASLGQDKGCTFSLLAAIRSSGVWPPCALLLTSAAILTVCLQQGEGGGKLLGAFGSAQGRLTAGVRVCTREPAVSMCCRQSWPDSCHISCALPALVAQRRWRGHSENGSSCLVTRQHQSRWGCLGYPSYSGSLLAASFQVIPGEGNSFGWMSEEFTQGEFRCGGCTAQRHFCLFIACLLLVSCSHLRKRQIKF